MYLVVSHRFKGMLNLFAKGIRSQKVYYPDEIQFVAQMAHKVRRPQPSILGIKEAKLSPNNVELMR